MIDSLLVAEEFLRAVGFKQAQGFEWSHAVIDHGQGAWLYGAFRRKEAVIAGWNQDSILVEQGSALLRSTLSDDSLPPRLRRHCELWGSRADALTICFWTTDGERWFHPKWLTGTLLADPLTVEDLSIVNGGRESLLGWLKTYHAVDLPHVAAAISDHAPLTPSLVVDAGNRVSFDVARERARVIGYPIGDGFRAR